MDSQLFFLLLLCFFSVSLTQHGVTFNGISEGDNSGWIVYFGGDINGDKIDDFLITAWHADPNNFTDAGQAYVIFGKNSSALFSSPFNIESLDGSNGFIINGLGDGDHLGDKACIGGDVNGDNIDDILIGAPYFNYAGSNDTGQSYLIFGRNSSFSSPFDLNSLNGSNGFKITGISNGDYLGVSVSLGGDVNNDGFHDIIIGAYYADPFNHEKAGQSYIIFGTNKPFNASFNLSSLNGSNGFTINGIAVDDRSGWSVSLGRDVNGDNIDDILIGADYADVPGLTDVGQSYIIFGRNTSSFPSQFNLSNSNSLNGFTFNGISGTYFGESVSLGGDVNGDGIGDILIGAISGGGFNGQGFIIFGNTTHLSDLKDLKGNNGFVINGIVSKGYLGRSCSLQGDVNGDSIDDIIIGGDYTNTAYIIFGTTTPFSSSFDLNSLNGTNGFKITGISRLGYSVAVGGDVNFDGISDILVGAIDELNFSGKTYLIFGSKSFPSNINVSSLLINQHISLNSFVVETEQIFSFQLNNTQFVSLLTPPLIYTISPLNNSMFNFNKLNFTLGGITLNQTGIFSIEISGEGSNGIVVGIIELKVIQKERDIVIPSESPSFSFQVPDPSGGVYHYDAHLSTGEPLPPFISFNSTTLIVSSSQTITVVPQTISVTVIGTDENGQEQVRYDYSLVFVGNSVSSSGSDVPIGAIVGGTVGGAILVVLVVIVVIVIVFILAKKHKSEF